MCHVAFIIKGGKVICVKTNSLTGVSKVIKTKNNVIGNSCHAEIGSIKAYMSTYHKKRKYRNCKLVLYSVAFKLVCDSDGNILSMYMSNAKPCKNCSSNIVSCKINFHTVVYSNHLNNIDNQFNFTKVRVRESARDYININMDSYLLKSSYKNYKLYRYYSKEYMKYVSKSVKNRDNRLIQTMKNSKYMIVPYDLYFREIAKNDVVVVELFGNQKSRIKIINKTVGDSIKSLYDSIDIDNYNIAFINNKNDIKKYKKMIKCKTKFVLIEYDIY